MNITVNVPGRFRARFNHANRRQASGFTLIELMIVMVIVAIGVTLSVPTFRAIIEKRQLTSATEEIAAFMNFARSEAIKRNQDVIVNMRRTGHDAWCIGVTLGTIPCDCREPDDTNNLLCEIEDVPRRMDQAAVLSNPDYELMHSMSSGTSDDNFTFDSIRGTLLDLNTVNFQMHTHTGSGETREYQLEVNIWPTGQVSICTATGRKLLMRQFPTCT